MNEDHIPVVLKGIREGRISEAEADSYLRERCGTTLAQARGNIAAANPAMTMNGSSTPREEDAQSARRTRTAVIASIVGIIILIMAFSIFMFDDPTGRATYTLTGGTHNDGIAIPYNVTSLRITGELRGEGTASVYFDTNEGASLHVATIRSDDGTPRTDKAGYEIGETIAVQNAPEDATYYFDDGTSSTTVIPPFAASVPGTLLVISIINGEPITHRLPIRINGEREEIRITPFEELCVETCNIDQTSGALRIVHDDGTALIIEEAVISVEEQNRAPTLAVQYAPATVEGTTIIELDGHFIDADNDALAYSTGSSDLVDTTIDGGTLTLTAKKAGTGTITIYASDLTELVQTELQITTIIPSAADNPANETGNTTINATTNTTINATDNNTIDTPLNGTNSTDTPTDTASNTTNNITSTIDTTTSANETNQTNATTSTTVSDCDNPNPNLRPAYCFTGNEEAVFEEPIAPMRDRQLHTVGRMTRYGNLVIRGVLRENSAAMPDSDAFSIGTTTTQDFRETYTASAWIDSTTGDLHLRGTAHQEQPTVVPPQYGSYIIQNNNGLVLAYFDRQTGDLYLRGSVVQLGKVV